MRVQVEGGGRAPAFLLSGRNHGGKDAAAYIEARRQAHEARPGGQREIIEYAIGDRFVKGALVTVRPDLQFEAFQLDAFAVRHVVEIERREVRLAGLRAQAGKLRYFHVNPVVAARLRIRERRERFGGGAGH